MNERATDERLREAVEYINGRLVWKARPIHHFAGRKLWQLWNEEVVNSEPFGRVDKDGYKFGSFHCRNLKQHRVVWFIEKGEWPKGQIDHLNGIRDDNRIENLKDVSVSENKRNVAGWKSSTGYPGVRKAGNYRTTRYYAMIRKDGVSHYLGTYDDPKEAYEIYLAKAKELGFTNRHGTKI